MTDRNKECINDYMYRMFLHFMDSSDAGRLSDELQDDVVSDIEETVDGDNWNGEHAPVLLDEWGQR